MWINIYNNIPDKLKQFKYVRLNFLMFSIITSLIEENDKKFWIHDMRPDKLEKLQGHNVGAAM